MSGLHPPKKDDPRVHPRVEALYGKFEAECTWHPCKGKLKFETSHSAGLKLGDTIPDDPRDANFGRCPICRRTRMRVTKVPEVRPPPGPKGFTKIPTE